MLKNTQELINKIVPNSKMAIIPARGGSKGVPKKNIRLLDRYPLISYSIAAGKMSQEIDRVVVSTDSEEIAEIAKYYGAEAPFLRPQKLATDNASDIEFVEHAIQWFFENENAIPEYFIHLRPTTPLRQIENVDQGIRMLIKNNMATSLRSGHLASESPLKWFLINENGYFESILKSINNDQANAARQEFPDVYIPDGYVDVLRTKFIIENGLLHGNKMIGFKSPACYEVDTEEDFKLIEFQIKNYGSEIKEYLEKNY